jgi:hypothetical protein
MRRVVRKNNFGGGNFLSLEFERSACTVGWTDIIGSIVGWLGTAALEQDTRSHYKVRM